ncbi:hypothetical protein CN198_34650 [Sinorhizobium meliloti]|nr:hypothetical protein CN198_34650 [Sinorhizobium meliloti]
MASIEDRNLSITSNNEMLYQSRMNVMPTMRGGDGFRVPTDAVCTFEPAPRSVSARRSGP